MKMKRSEKLERKKAREQKKMERQQKAPKRPVASKPKRKPASQTTPVAPRPKRKATSHTAPAGRSDNVCGVCEGEWADETDDMEIWLDCNNCGGWFHANCIGFDDHTKEELEDVTYTCLDCT